jgi:hypothetical protein
MGTALKQPNKWALTGVVVVNIVLFLALLNGTSLIDWTSLLSSVIRALPAGVGVGLVGVLNAQLSAETKARLVFFRWHNPLPASRAFSQLVHQDPRIDVRRLAEIVGPFPTGSKEQNAKWYGLYKSVEAEPSVVQVHRAYLFTRDYTCLAAMMFLLLTPLAFFTFPSWRLAAAFAAAVLIQFLLVRRAARHHGVRFVTNVLALKAAG